MPMAWPDWHVKERAPEINDAEDLGSTDLTGEVSQQGEGVSIHHCHLVERAKICTGTGSTSWLVCNVKGGAELGISIRFDLLDYAILYHLIPSGFTRGCLGRIHYYWPPFCFTGWSIRRRVYPVVDPMGWLAFCERGIEELRVSFNHLYIFLVMHFQLFFY